MKPFLAVGLVACWILACSPSGGDLGEGVVARIGDRDIAYQDFESFLDEGVGEGGTGLDNEVLAALFEQFLEEELLLELAVERGLVHAAATRRRALEALLAERGKEPVTGEEVAAYYAAHKEEFRLQERVRLRQLLLEDREQAEAVRAQLEQGADFVDVARSLGDPGVLDGVEQGELTRDDLPQEFVEPVFGLQPGEVSDILEEDYGFHVFQVVERLGAAVVPLEQVGPAVRRRLETERADQAISVLLEEARERYNVRIAAASLPFSYPPESAAEAP